MNQVASKVKQLDTHHVPCLVEVCQLKQISYWIVVYQMLLQKVEKPCNIIKWHQHQLICP